MPEFDLDAALSLPGDPNRNRTGRCVCGNQKDYEVSYCLPCMQARCGPVHRAIRRLDHGGVLDADGIADFAVWMWSKVGMGFHPDTSIEDYANFDTGEQTFHDPDDARDAARWLDQALAVANEQELDIYEISGTAQENYVKGILRAAGKVHAGLNMPELWQSLCALGDPQGPPLN